MNRNATTYHPDMNQIIKIKFPSREVGYKSMQNKQYYLWINLMITKMSADIMKRYKICHTLFC